MENKKMLHMSQVYTLPRDGSTHPQSGGASLTGLRPLSFKERGLGGELIDRLELINFIIMHNTYLLIQPWNSEIGRLEKIPPRG